MKKIPQYLENKFRDCFGTTQYSPDCGICKGCPIKKYCK